MREILFRGKRTDTGEWVYGYYTEHSAGSISPTIETSTDDFAVDPDTIGQFTGILDKNGTRIFDGDILDLSIIKEHNPVFVEYKNGAYGFSPVFPESVHPDDVKWKSFWCADDEEMWDAEYFAVIGNVHDNPELLVESK